MSGFLGGMFKPDDYITYKDASKAFLTMLGYADSDFTGDLATSRISKFNYLELNEKVSRQPDEVLNQTDCVNIFYNLLKAKKKDSNEIYGAVLGLSLIHIYSVRHGRGLVGQHFQVRFRHGAVSYTHLDVYKRQPHRKQRRRARRKEKKRTVF